MGWVLLEFLGAGLLAYVLWLGLTKLAERQQRKRKDANNGSTNE